MIENLKELLPSPLVVAALAGALLAAIRKGPYSWGQRVTAFVTGFICAIYIAPAIYDYLGIMSESARNGIVFVVGISANWIIPPIVSYLEEKAPKWLDKYLSRKIKTDE